MRVWVTGGSGQVGRRLCLALVGLGHEVTVLGRRSPPYLSLQRWRSWDMSSDEVPVADLEAPDAVFHLAAQTSAHSARESLSRDVATNMVGFARLLDALRFKGSSPHVVLAGAATEVGITNDGTVDDHLPDNPGTFYDVGKICQRLYLEQCGREGWIDATVLRFSNIYGGVEPPSSAHRGFIDQSIDRALSGDELHYFDDAEYVRDFIYVDDVVASLIYAMSNRSVVSGAKYMIGSGNGMPISKALECIAELAHEMTGIMVPVVPIAAPSLLYEIEKRNVVVTANRFQQQTGWRPLTSFSEGIRRSILERISR